MRSEWCERRQARDIENPTDVCSDYNYALDTFLIPHYVVPRQGYAVGGFAMPIEELRKQVNGTSMTGVRDEVCRLGALPTFDSPCLSPIDKVMALVGAK